MAGHWPHLHQISSELVPLQDCEIGLLIGYNCPKALLPREVIPPIGDGPYGQKTDIGWGIVGLIDPTQVENRSSDPIGFSHRILSYDVPSYTFQNASQTSFEDCAPNKIEICFQSSIKEIDPAHIVKLLESDFSERSFNTIAYSQDDFKFLSKLRDGIHRTADGHYEKPLPFKTSNPRFPDNKDLALHFLRRLERPFRLDTKYRAEYEAFMKDLLSERYAERVPQEEIVGTNGGINYIPHHGVYHPKKLRVVFDCSARFKGQCLNQYLLQDLTNTLIGVLCRFGHEPVAFMCDIKAMFHQFSVNPEHRDFLRFLWWENGDLQSDPVEYRMRVHLFGATSSPGCANFGLKQSAIDHEKEYGSDVGDFIRHNFYVDDGLKSVATEDEAAHLINRSKLLCQLIGLKLHKFTSNSTKVMGTHPPEEHSKGVKDLNVMYNSRNIERALGVYWCVESDTFQFRISLQDKPLTRRGILSIVSSVYDPLGFLAPVV
ncbi:uncharacterized protein [Apostichopus japonicus]|uniref:uncharacterized protein n=1 Tax=Stichopus japonicus TaxID=307972 RepID=UPI003AB89BF8